MIMTMLMIMTMMMVILIIMMITTVMMRVINGCDDHDEENEDN